MAAPLRSFWDNYFRPPLVQSDAEDVAYGTIINFIGGTVVYNPTHARVDVTLGGGEGGAVEAGTLTVTETGTLNNVATTDTGVPSGGVRFTGAAPTVTGLASGADKRRIVVMAVGGPLVLANESASSSAANRIITGTGANLSLAQNTSALLAYDATTGRWRVVGVFAALGPTITVAGTGAQNDLATDASGVAAAIVRFTGNGTVTLNGLAGGAESRRLLLVAATATTVLQLADEAGGSTAANRIVIPGGPSPDSSPITVPPLSALEVVYDSTSSRWRIVGAPKPLGPTLTVSGTGAQNDLASTEAGFRADVIRFTGNGTVTVNGIAGGGESRRIRLVPATDNTVLQIANEAAGSTAANRVLLPAGVSSPLVVTKHSSIELVYDSSDSRWRVEFQPPPAATGPVVIANNTTGTANDIASDSSGTPATEIDFTGASVTLTSIAGGTGGRRVTLLMRVAAGTIQHDSGGTAANRIVCPGGRDFFVPTGGAVDVIYSAADSRWYVLAQRATPPTAVGQDRLVDEQSPQNLQEKTLIQPAVKTQSGNTMAVAGTVEVGTIASEFIDDDWRILSVVNRVNTSATTTVSLVEFAMADDTFLTISVALQYTRQGAVTKAAWYRLSVGYRRTGGGDPTIVGTLDKIVGGETTAADDVTIDVDTTTDRVRVRITPADTDARSWTAEARIQEQNDAA